MHNAAEAQINDHAQTFFVTPFILVVLVKPTGNNEIKALLRAQK
jgi:hypothetical protein